MGQAVNAVEEGSVGVDAAQVVTVLAARVLFVFSVPAARYTVAAPVLCSRVRVRSTESSVGAHLSEDCFRRSARSTKEVCCFPGGRRSRARNGENLEAERRMRNRGDAARDQSGQQAEAEVFIA